MKMIFLLLGLLVFAIASFSQARGDSASGKEYYLKKSKDMKTVGWVMLAGGTTMATIAAISLSRSDLGSSGDMGEFWLESSRTLVAGLFLVGGITADIISIPFFVSSSKWARKAATISFNEQKILLLQHNNLTVRMQPSITVRIGLK